MPSVEANGLTLHYEEQGRPGDPVMLLVMGLGVQLLFWPDELCDALAGHGFRVIRFDNRDVGLSTKLHDHGEPNIALEAIKYALHMQVKASYRIDDMARDTAAFMDALGIARAHVIGASMGGMIAQNLAVDAPGKVASLTSMMSTTGARNLPHPKARVYKTLLMVPPRDGNFDEGVTRMMKLLRIIGSRTYPPSDAWLRAFVERHVRRSYYPAGGARQLVAIAASGDRTEIVKRIKAPTLVIHGDEDPLLPLPCGLATAEAIEAGGGQVTMRTFHGMAHDFPLPLIPEMAQEIARHCRAAA